MELEGSRERTVKPQAPVVGQFRPWQKRPCFLCHHLTYSPVWNESSCFFTVPHNGTKWLWLAMLQLAAKRLRRREKKGKQVQRRYGRRRERCCLVISDAERERSHSSIWAEINITSFFFCACVSQQTIREATTEATDGLGSHRLRKYLEVYTSQTKSQIGSRAEAVLRLKK